MLILTRFANKSDVTIGQLTLDNEQRFYTVERPWENNTPNVSCIPTGHYVMNRVNSPRFGDNMWEVSYVKGRSHILIHVANKPEDLLGCIGLGMTVYPDLSGVGSSRDAINAFYEATKHLKTIDLYIYEGCI